MTTETSMAERRASLQRFGARVDAIIGPLMTRPGLVVLVVVALGVYAVEYQAWTLQAGRDLTTYLQYFTDLSFRPAVLPNLMGNVQPLAPVTFGLLLEHGGATGTAVVLALMFAASIACYTLLALSFGKRVAFATAVLLLVYPPFASLFHQVSTDSLFAFLTAVWWLWLARTLRRPTWWLLVGNAVLLLALVWTRVAAEAFAVVVLAPLFLRVDWRRRATFGLALAASVAVAVGSLVLFNGLAFGEYTTGRTANAGNPLYLVFTFDHLVNPSNGPASRELAAAVRSHLLNRQPYRAYHITTREFFQSASPRFWSDLVPLSDRVWGWSSEYTKLRAVGLEAIRAHPGAYAHGVVRSVDDYFTTPYYRGATPRPSPAAGSGSAQFVVIGGKRLPAPTENQPIPAANLDWELSTPDQSIWTDWSSIAHPVIRFKRPSVGREYREMVARAARLQDELGTRSGSPWLAHQLNRVEHLFPPLWMWLLVGLIGCILRRPRHLLVAWALVVLGLAVVGVAAFVQPFTPEYRIPFDPAFILVGLVGLIGARAPAAREVPLREEETLSRAHGPAAQPDLE